MLNFPLVIIGSQWGDEGKGKIVDLLAKKADYVVRYNGGNNAGHTVVLKKEKFQLSLLPSGVLHQKQLFIAQGEVINPAVLLSEISFFKKKGIKVKLTIDPRVNIVMPYHGQLDAATEAWKGKEATGSLHLGIGYCYEDRNNRLGIRLEDLINPPILKEKLKRILPLKKRQIELVFKHKADLNLETIFKEYQNFGKKLKPYLGDVSLVIGQNLKKKKILFEGAHGTFLDGVFGTFPYTTAVTTISGGVFAYIGIPPQKIFSLGIVKAYTTRVGNGPFVTEQTNEIGQILQTQGQEFGTVSKRKRRCGWLDLCMLRTASRLSGFDYLALTKLDVLSTLPLIRICTHYLLRGKKIFETPLLLSDLPFCRPVYHEFKGWRQNISKIRKWKDLPGETKTYIKFIEKKLGVPIKIISVGSERSQNIFI